MTTRTQISYVAGAILIASLALSQPALAQQQQGVTSGPAVGTTVAPSTATQKQSPGAGQSGTAAAVGAPGVAAKPGSEGGSSPGPGTGKRP